MKRKKTKSIIPGFGISMGITVTILSLIVLIPLCSLVVFSARLSFSDFIQTVTGARVRSSYFVSISTAFIASLINAVMGLVLAWVLVRYEFPGKRLIDGLIELPFALPTAVAGISLTHLTTTNGWVGSVFDRLFGIRIAYTRVGITAALVFIGIPFVVRAVQPVLEKVDHECEEAAMLLGADSGEILMNGRVVNNVPGSERGIGFVFQNYALFRYMTVYDNIAFGLRVKKIPKKEVDERVKELLKLIGCEGLEKRYPGQLSGGQKQRVAFAYRMFILTKDSVRLAPNLSLKENTVVI